MAESITIAGGGLAGLTLGIGLRRLGVPVTVWEAGRYPRHRVCGEFISGRGQDSLARLGLLTGLKDAGAAWAKSAAFFDSAGSVAPRPLPEAALCISRFALDAWFAGEFARLGGELRVGARWSGDSSEAVVRATGRRAEPLSREGRLFGLKVHAGNVALAADLEIHFVRNGYVGLCRLPGGEVNVCGLFRSHAAVPGLAQHWREWLCGGTGSELRERMASARFDDDSFCSVAGLNLRPRRAAQLDECCVGDALTMIPPFTGNGMSMAFESAELAIEPLAKFSRGILKWDEARKEIARRCDERFAPRLRWAAWLQRALFQPATRAAIVFAAGRSHWFWRKMFERTR